MNKLFLAIAATTASLCVLFPVQSVRAANLGFTVTENLTDSTTPAPGVSGLYLFKNLVSAEGQITSIDGFSSLQGVNPSSLTLNYGNLELLSYKNENGTLYTSGGKSGSKTPYFNLLQNGQVIATSNDLQSSSALNVTVGSPHYGEATNTLKVALNGVIGNPFFEEIKKLTQGTGILELTLGTPNGIIYNLPISTDTHGSFTYTGGTIVAATPKPTSVPEPGLVGALLTIGTGFIFKKRGNLQKVSAS